MFEFITKLFVTEKRYPDVERSERQIEDACRRLGVTEDEFFVSAARGMRAAAEGGKKRGNK